MISQTLADLAVWRARKGAILFRSALRYSRAARRAGDPATAEPGRRSTT